MSWLRISLVFIGAWVIISSLMWIIQWVYGLWTDSTGLVFLEFFAICIAAFISGLYASENEIKPK